ncbi:hypothetical protein [Desulfonema magnum]|uniref:Uncharacterized protein n=1 Tax=Desulfonema magnum TaxID=45655 RepID=A0A975BI27_9BACT|nr:hypothetical protein [Desulfonema magnum]QTA85450.1 Uncharacterized protein dnm_014600 [Desulfonema magnum]
MKLETRNLFRRSGFQFQVSIVQFETRNSKLVPKIRFPVSSFNRSV